MRQAGKAGRAVVAAVLWIGLGAGQALAADSGALSILRDGLLGAGVGAISAETSGGKAGKGALIGAGVNVLGNAIFGLFTGSSRSASYAQPATYAPAQQYTYAAPQTAYVPVEPVYYTPPAPVYTVSQTQPDSNRQILKQGLLGAGVGAISASASGGKAGQGALIGAGTNVIGGALFDVLLSPSQTSGAPAYAAASYAPRTTAPGGVVNGSRKHILRKYDADGRLISEEEYWD